MGETFLDYCFLSDFDRNTSCGFPSISASTSPASKERGERIEAFSELLKIFVTLLGRASSIVVV